MKCHIRKKLEQLNKIGSDAFMIPAIGEANVGATVGEKRKPPSSPPYLATGNGEEMVSVLNLPFDDNDLHERVVCLIRKLIALCQRQLLRC